MDSLFFADDFSALLAFEEKPFTLPLMNSERQRLFFDRQLVERERVFHQKEQLTERLVQKASSINYTEQSFHQTVNQSLFWYDHQPFLHFSPQISISVVQNRGESSEELFEKLEKRLCEEIKTELGGYLRW